MKTTDREVMKLLKTSIKDETVKKCPVCEGRGKHVWDGNTINCTWCKGTGWAPERETKLMG